MKNELVKDWMTRDVITIPADTSIYEAHRLMREYGIRRLPVVEGNELVGIVTRGDIRGAEPSEATSLSVWEINYLLSKTTVREIMTPDPLTIPQTASIGQAAKLMLSKKISGLPVVDMAKNLIGVITESDIFRLIVQEWEASELTDLEPEPALAAA